MFYSCDVCNRLFPSLKEARRHEVSHFIEKEMKHRKGRSREQAIAIGFSRARHAGIRVPKKR